MNMLYKFLMLHIYTIPTMKFGAFKVIVQSFITAKDSLHLSVSNNLMLMNLRFFFLLNEL